jgi:hypothetical protein
MVAYTCNSSTGEAEAGGLEVPGQPGLYGEILIKKQQTKSEVPVAHICNSSYSGGRDQEDLGLKPALANCS